MTGYERKNVRGAAVIARPAVLDAVLAALDSDGSLYAWAARQEGRDVFTGRGAVFGVTLGGSRAVVRHARRGGTLAALLGDRYFGAPRFLSEIAIAGRLQAAGVPTPQVLAGVRYPGGLVHRADVATERVDGTDLFTLFWGTTPPGGDARRLIFRAVGAMVRRLHAAGFIHPDLQLRNVLIEGWQTTALPPYRPTAWLLDVDTCRAVQPNDDAGRRANLDRFHRSWEKWNARSGRRLTPDDFAAFLGGYRESPA